MTNVLTEFHWIRFLTKGDINYTISKSEDDEVYEIIKRKVNNRYNSSTLLGAEYLSKEKYEKFIQDNTVEGNQNS